MRSGQEAELFSASPHLRVPFPPRHLPLVTRKQSVNFWTLYKGNLIAWIPSFLVYFVEQAVCGVQSCPTSFCTSAPDLSRTKWLANNLSFFYRLESLVYSWWYFSVFCRIGQESRVCLTVTRGEDFHLGCISFLIIGWFRFSPVSTLAIDCTQFVNFL